MTSTNQKLVNNETPAKAVETLNKLDLVSIEALISYMAYRHNIEEAFIKRAIYVRFKVDDLKKLPHAARESVIKFLADYTPIANSR